MHIHPLRDQDAESERLLRARAQHRGSDPEVSVEQIRTALTNERIAAATLIDEHNTAHGIAAWRWLDHTYAQVLFLYTPPDSPPEHSAQLVDHMITTITTIPTLRVIEARLRDDSPGMYDAWKAHQFAIFKRCRVRRSLHPAVPLPITPTPVGYRLTRWTRDHTAQAQIVALSAYNTGIESVAAPTLTPDAILRSAQNGSGWLSEASSVALDQHDRVVGYIAITRNGDDAFITDLAIHPDHRRRGLARVLLIRAMRGCIQHTVPALTAAMTMQHPARHLFDRLNFQPTACGEIAIWWRDGRQMEWRA